MAGPRATSCELVMAKAWSSENVAHRLRDQESVTETKNAANVLHRVESQQGPVGIHDCRFLLCHHEEVNAWKGVGASLAAEMVDYTALSQRCFHYCFLHPTLTSFAAQLFRRRTWKAAGHRTDPGDPEKRSVSWELSCKVPAGGRNRRLRVPHAFDVLREHHTDEHELVVTLDAACMETVVGMKGSCRSDNEKSEKKNTIQKLILVLKIYHAKIIKT